MGLRLPEENAATTRARIKRRWPDAEKQAPDAAIKAVIDRVSVNDLHATFLHLVGLDHKKLTYRFNGRDFRLTDVAGVVVKEILA